VFIKGVRIILKDDSATQDNKNIRPPFWFVLLQVTKIAIAVDVGLFFLFHYLNSPIMAWFNVFSIACYAGAYTALKRRKNTFATVLISVEVFSHITLGVFVLGWESGFAYYLIMFIPSICLSTAIKPAIASLTGLFLFIAFLNIGSYMFDPIQPIDDFALQLVHLGNLAIVFSMLSYLSFYYLASVRRTQSKLHKLATTDSLTKLLNRRQITKLSTNALDKESQHTRKMSLMIFDLDHFKVVNDTYGHEIGDQVLVKCSSLLNNELRSTDLLSRWGGEEFLIVMPNIDLAIAQQKAELIRKKIKHFDWKQEIGVPLSITISGGLAEIEVNETLSHAIGRADKALYRSKRSGRDCIELASKLPSEHVDA